MAYTGYVEASYYDEVYGGSAIPAESLQQALRQASRHIDTLTFNRITDAGFDGLTEFQKEIIREVVCRQADFEYENADMIDMVLSQYSINGVSMSFGNSWNVAVDNGVAIRRDVYAQLRQTGLCCRRL